MTTEEWDDIFPNREDIDEATDYLEGCYPFKGLFYYYRSLRKLKRKVKYSKIRKVTRLSRIFDK